jgi:PEP-CTERM motif
MGSGYENPDGIAHASVDYVYTHAAVIGFEDLFGGGDVDYNDVKIRVAGYMGISQVPEPSALLLIGSGIPTLILISRRKRAEIRNFQTLPITVTGTHTDYCIFTRLALTYAGLA